MTILQKIKLYIITKTTFFAKVYCWFIVAVTKLLSFDDVLRSIQSNM